MIISYLYCEIRVYKRIVEQNWFVIRFSLTMNFF